MEAALKEKIDSFVARHPDKRVAFVAGNFNIIHPGHLRVLHFARSCGDVLLIALFNDGSPGTLVPAEKRRMSLLALEAVGDVIEVSNADLVDLIGYLRPEFVVKGKEHEDKVNPELEAVASYGGHVLFSGGEERFSSRDLIRHELLHSSLPSLIRPKAFLSEQKIQHQRIRTVVDGFSSARVLVLGELIVDEYVHCEPIGMSQEEPTIVVSPIESSRYIGAAAIVSAHIAGLGAKVDFITVTGKDAIAEDSLARLNTFGVRAHYLYDETRPTILKQRFRARGRSLLRVNHLASHDIESAIQTEFFENVMQHLPLVDLVVFSDFNYGCLPQSLVTRVISACTSLGVKFAADSQASSQVGNIARFGGAALLSATEREVRLAVNDFKSGIQSVANELLTRSNAEQIVVKLGHEGLILLTKKREPATASLPALNPNPTDVAGAGDALLSAYCLSMMSGGDPFESALLGSLAAALQVGRQGNVPLTSSELRQAVDSLFSL